jgi:hypothetical protein
MVGRRSRPEPLATVGPGAREYNAYVNALGLMFLPVGIALVYYGAPAITTAAVRRKRVADEERRDLITRGGTRLSEPSESREAAFGWIAAALGVAFVVAGLSLLF